MDNQLSPLAQRILDAGVSAVREEGDGDGKLEQSDRAIEHVIADICHEYRPDGETAAIDTLVEIAQLHVRHMVTHHN